VQLQALGSPGWEQSAPADLRHEHRQPDLANEGGLAAHVGAGDEVEPGLQRGRRKQQRRQLGMLRPEQGTMLQVIGVLAGRCVACRCVQFCLGWVHAMSVCQIIARAWPDTIGSQLSQARWEAVAHPMAGRNAGPANGPTATHAEPPTRKSAADLAFEHAAVVGYEVNALLRLEARVPAPQQRDLSLCSSTGRGQRWRQGGRGKVGKAGQLRGVEAGRQSGTQLG
jgi:hypothetical protein